MNVLSTMVKRAAMSGRGLEERSRASLGIASSFSATVPDPAPPAGDPVPPLPMPSEPQGSVAEESVAAPAPPPALPALAPATAPSQYPPAVQQLIQDLEQQT